MWRKSEVWKSKWFLAAVVLQAVLLLAGIVGLCRGSRVAAGPENMQITLNGGEAGETEGSFVIDGSYGFRGHFMECGGITLRPGVYRLRLLCDSEDNDINTLGIECPGQAFHTLRTNDIPLYAGRREFTSDFYVLRKMGEEDGLRAYVNYNGSGRLTVERLEIIKTTGGSRILIFLVLVCSVVVDSLIMLYAYMGRYKVEKEQLMVWFGVPALALLASIPLLVDYALMGADSIYHWNRIEALAEELAKGVFPVRMASRWLYGHGYASSLFYPDTFLVIAVIFRWIGFPVTTAYNLYLFTVNLATAWIAYASFRGIFRDRRLGLLGSMLFTLAPYRIYNIYNRSAVGELTAMTFLPLLCWGFYLIFAEDITERKYRRCWLIPVLGFTGIIQSHLLSCEIVGGFVVVLCLTLWKRTFRGRTFAELVKVVLGTALLNLWFILPCLDMMTAGKYLYSNNSNVYIQNRGILWANVLDTMQTAGRNSKFYQYGMRDTEPIGIGAAALFGVAAFWALRRKKTEDPAAKAQDTGALTACALGAVGLLLSSAYFPWDFIKSKVGALGGLVSMIQFPTRLTMIPVICAVFVGCVAGMWALRSASRALRYGFFGIICAACVLFSLYQTNDTLMVKGGFLRIYTPAAMGNSGILGAEYLPLGVNYPSGYHEPYASDGVEISSFAKDGLNCAFYAEADGAGEQYVDLPMLYYKGYRVMENTGAKIAQGENGHVRVLLPEGGYQGEIRVRYTGMWYWRLAEAVSALTLLGIFAYWYLTTRGKFTTINAVEKQ